MLRNLYKAAENIDAVFSGASNDNDEWAQKTLSIDGQVVRLGRVIAEGGFSFVHRAEYVGGTSSRPIAVKRLSTVEHDGLTRARAEAGVLARLPRHPNVVQYLGSSFSGSAAFLAFEMLDGGSLAETLDRRRSRPLSSEEALDVFFDVVAAVVHLHAQSPPIACRDVKLENLLYDREQRRYKLCDFGSCTTSARRYTNRREILQEEDVVKENSSAPYRAPELVDLYSKQFVCEKADVWALGCIWYAILYGKLPFDGQSSIPILKGRYDVPENRAYPESFGKMLAAMLTVPVDKRADSFAILEAVCRLRGVNMDPSLWRIGQELRSRRAKDCSTEHVEMSTLERGTDICLHELEYSDQGGQTNFAARPFFASGQSKAGGSSGVFIDIDTDGATKLSKSRNTADAARIDMQFCDAEDGDGDWADFEQAFGPEASDQPVVRNKAFEEPRGGEESQQSMSKQLNIAALYAAGDCYSHKQDSCIASNYRS